MLELCLGYLFGFGDSGAHVLDTSDVGVFVQHQFPELNVAFGALFEGALELDFLVGVVVVPVYFREPGVLLVVVLLHLVLYHLQVVVLVEPVYHAALFLADYPPHRVVGLGPVAGFVELQHPYEGVRLPLLREFLAEGLQQGDEEVETVQLYLGDVLLLIGR